jgi:chromosome segregation ATPase
MHAPGSRRLSRRETEQAAVDGGAEQRRLEATVARLRLELARLRGEVDDDVPTAAAASPDAAGPVPQEDAGEAAAEAEARATGAEERVRLLAEELGAERRSLDELRSRLAALEEADREREAELAGRAAARERLSELESALAEEREARLMLETLRDGLEKAMEEQRLRHEREVADVQKAAEDRRTEQTLGHVRELERGRGELEAARIECAALVARLEEEGQARSRAETRVRQLDREVDELRNWISAAESRRRGLFRRTSMPPPPGRIRPGP